MSVSSSDDEVEDITPAGGQQQQQQDDPNAGLPALFWDTLPDNAEEHPDFIALKALDDETTPEERAENFKVQGNNKLKVGLQAKNPLLLREAVDFYKKGLGVQCADTALNVALYNNKAHVDSLLGNWRNALRDSQQALKLDPSSLKAVFRGARAALKLGEWQTCRQLLQRGLELEADAKELLQIQQELEPAEAKAAAEAAAREAAQTAAIAPAKQLAAALTLCGYRLTLPEVNLGARKPYVDTSDGSVHWPVLLMYPETGQQDVIEDWHEDVPVEAHLDVMFGPEAPPLPWDEAKEYSRERVQLYYLSNAGQPLKQDQLVQALHGNWPELQQQSGPQRYGKQASHWVPVDASLSLREVLLQPDHVIAGLPLFWVLARDTDYQQRFLAEELNRF